MRETSSPPSEMCFMTTFLSDGEAVVTASCFVQESKGARHVRVPVDRGTGRVPQEAASRVYAASRGHEEGDPRFPHLPPRPDHARAGGAALLRQSPRARTPPRGGR